MNRNELRATIVEELAKIAPDIDTPSIDDRVRLRREYDLDSMDSLNLLMALHKRLGIEIPESDYARMQSINDLLDYLEPQVER